MFHVSRANSAIDAETCHIVCGWSVEKMRTNAQGLSEIATVLHTLFAGEYVTFSHPHRVPDEEWYDTNIYTITMNDTPKY